MMDVRSSGHLGHLWPKFLHKRQFFAAFMFKVIRGEMQLEKLEPFLHFLQRFALFTLDATQVFSLVKKLN
jgi:hypothetical protein